MLYAKLVDGGDPVFPLSEGHVRAAANAIGIGLPLSLGEVDLSDLRGVDPDADVPLVSEEDDVREPEWVHLHFVAIEEVPRPAGEVPQESFLRAQGDGWVMDWRALPESEEDAAARIEAVKAGLLLSLDQQAGAFRTRFITDVPGQTETYLAKQAEAEAWAVSPDGDYVMLAAEASATGTTVADVAALVSATAAQWRALGAKIEGARMGAKKGVRDAATLSEARSAASVNWEGLLA